MSNTCFVCFLVLGVLRKNAFDIYWPLVQSHLFGETISFNRNICSIQTWLFEQNCLHCSWVGVQCSSAKKFFCKSSQRVHTQTKCALSWGGVVVGSSNVGSLLLNGKSVSSLPENLFFSPPKSFLEIRPFSKHSVLYMHQKSKFAMPGFAPIWPKSRVFLLRQIWIVKYSTVDCKYLFSLQEI